jgi:hypothetical protein
MYLLMVVSPLASLAMHSKAVSHAITGECSGDCDICGCSPEGRASNTCCCSKKRRQQAQAYEKENSPDCCKKKPVNKNAVIACGCPCGSGKPADLSASSSSELLPYYYTERLSIPHVETLFTNLSHRLASRHSEPPDPPPRLPLIS